MANDSKRKKTYGTLLYILSLEMSSGNSDGNLTVYPYVLGMSDGDLSIGTVAFATLSNRVITTKGG